jgi:hypothetical protein
MGGLRSAVGGETDGRQTARVKCDWPSAPCARASARARPVELDHSLRQLARRRSTGSIGWRDPRGQRAGAAPRTRSTTGSSKEKAFSKAHEKKPVLMIGMQTPQQNALVGRARPLRLRQRHDDTLPSNIESARAISSEVCLGSLPWRTGCDQEGFRTESRRLDQPLTPLSLPDIRYLLRSLPCGSGLTPSAVACPRCSSPCSPSGRDLRGNSSRCGAGHVRRKATQCGISPGRLSLPPGTAVRTGQCYGPWRVAAALFGECRAALRTDACGTDSTAAGAQSRR